MTDAVLREQLRQQFRHVLFMPVHIDHQNIEPDGITITKEGKDYYLDKLTDIAVEAIAHYTPDMERACLEARIDTLERLPASLRTCTCFTCKIVRERLAQLTKQLEEGK